MDSSALYFFLYHSLSTLCLVSISNEVYFFCRNFFFLWCLPFLICSNTHRLTKVWYATTTESVSTIRQKETKKLWDISKTKYLYNLSIEDVIFSCFRSTNGVDFKSRETPHFVRFFFVQIWKRKTLCTVLSISIQNKWWSDWLLSINNHMKRIFEIELNATMRRNVGILKSLWELEFSLFVVNSKAHDFLGVVTSHWTVEALKNQN